MKAQRLRDSAQYVTREFRGKMPDSIDKLVKIPGVGRKTANIILTYGFGKTQGIAVDTHVGRVTYRLGLTKSLNPKRAEKDLMEAFRKPDWESVNDLFIDHGRKVCKSQKPQCSRCVLSKDCPRNGVLKSA
jgi:endonuclease-3